MAGDQVLSDGTFLTHTLDCPGPDVHVARGVTKALLTCRACHSEAWVPLEEIS
ncbi:hypothetical protein [Segeticoccus rhizosphaerae]|uniref:hypothetical protein n=1 Tax=Segeticoccus rhizosphaerae TaxID=1104777 RepID=UPI001396A58C|nr:hypothetical protein [Segeticoccus rhizosphaerae]